MILFRLIQPPNQPNPFTYRRMWLIYIATQERRLWGQLGWVTMITGERN